MRRLLGNPAVAQRLLLRQTLPRERLLRRRMDAEFNSVVRNAAVAVVQGNEADSRGHEERTFRLLRTSYAEGMPVFAEIIFRALGVKAPKPRDKFERLMKDWIDTNSLKKSQQIAGTTRQQLRNVISMAREEGLGSSAIASRLREEVGETLGRARSLTIARTEVHTAANAAQWQAAESLEELGMRREWIAASDERTRDDHAEADGQVVGLNEPFNVGGEELMFPGDPSASPEQIINCRCTTGFILAE